MLHTLERAVSFYHQKDVWKKLMMDAMSQDYSWGQSAFKYNQLYSNLTSTPS
jgi:starch synthase